MKRILFLGGAPTQVPAIRYAREAGYHVITADYLPENPGHKLAHEYYNVSTTDVEAILSLAGRLAIDGVVAYASDPAAPTAARVAEALGLPTNPSEVVETLTRKDLYRSFLSRNGFASPKHRSCSTIAEAREAQAQLNLPVVVKPVDSSGSKGVQVLRDWQALPSAWNDALGHSRAQRVILEEFVGHMGEQIIGEAFVWNGELVASCLGRHRFDEQINGLVPVGGDFPCGDGNLRARLRAELQKLITRVGLTMGPMNLEFRLGQDDRVYLMEVAARNGGNMLPQLLTRATGFDVVKNTVDIALGFPCDRVAFPVGQGFHSYLVLHSRHDGVLQKLSFSPHLQSRIAEANVWTRPGDKVFAFTGANRSLGVLILSFDSAAEMTATMDGIENHVELVVA